MGGNMKKYGLRILVILIVIILGINVVGLNSAMAIGDVIDDYSSYKPSSTTSADDKPLKDKANALLGAINVIGIVVSVITLMIIGIGYMFGSIEEKVTYKEKLVPWIIGAVLTFAVTTLPNLIYKFVISID